MQQKNAAIGIGVKAKATTLLQDIGGGYGTEEGVPGTAAQRGILMTNSDDEDLMAISNRFTILPKDASVHPDDAPAVSTSPAPEVTSAASAASHGKATRRSSAVNDRRMLLKEAVIRRSGGLPGGSLKQSPRLCPPAQTPHSGLSTSKPREAAPTSVRQPAHLAPPVPSFLPPR
ncbi:hypothetical protein PAMA_000006 [Pampus argenteus]